MRWSNLVILPSTPGCAAASAEGAVIALIGGVIIRVDVAG
jgi:hypothetical protein